MNFTFHQLKILHTVAHFQSITKAAEALLLTQPAVSLQLKKLQDQFPIPLTEVVGRKIYITDFGAEIVKAAQKILEEVEAINYQTHAFKNQLAGKLQISVASTGKYVMPYFLSGFMRLHKGVDLMMDVTNKSLVVSSLEKNEVDFALVSVIPDQLQTHRINLLENKLFLVGSPRIRTTKRKATNTIFEAFPLLFREPGSATRNAMENFIREYQLPVFKKIELTSNEALKQSLIAGLGYSIMPLIGIKNALESNELEIIPFKGLPIVTQWNLIWLKAKKLSPVAQTYLDYINQEKEAIVARQFAWCENH